LAGLALPEGAWTAGWCWSDIFKTGTADHSATPIPT